jgi:DNA topoisomerase-1
MELVEAYLARRALDYLVGFTLSPVLWRKLPGARSAGRVQSVALRLITERESEIERFVSQEYWSVDADVRTDGADALIPAKLHRFEGKKITRLTIGEEARGAPPKRRSRRHFTVAAVEAKPTKRTPPRPSPPRPCSRKRRASSALTPSAPCAPLSVCMKAWRSAARRSA